MKWVLDHLKIVQDQQEPALQFQDVVDESCADDLAGGNLSGAQYALDVVAQVFVNPLQGSDKIGEKPSGVIIRGVQGQPGNRQVQCFCPFTDAGRFSKSGWRRDQRNPSASLEPLIQSLAEMRASDSFEKRGRTM